MVRQHALLEVARLTWILQDEDKEFKSGGIHFPCLLSKLLAISLSNWFLVIDRENHTQYGF